MGKTGSKTEHLTLDSHDDDCFDKIDADLSLHTNANSLTMTLTPGNKKKNANCTEHILVGSILTLHRAFLTDENKPY